MENVQFSTDGFRYTTRNFPCSQVNNNKALDELAENTTVDVDIVGAGVSLQVAAPLPACRTLLWESYAHTLV